MPYRKHYPPGAARTTARRHFFALLRRTPGRRARWQYQTQRRRPWLVRPLTAGEQNLLAYRLLAQELATRLEPFRRTRLRGHDELGGLLLDADTRPAVVAQVRALRACLDRIAPEFTRHGQHLMRWRSQWATATEAQRQALNQREKAVAISRYHDGLDLLLSEARADLSTIEALCPTAFAAAPAPEPWLDNAAKPGPTPYSA